MSDMFGYRLEWKPGEYTYCLKENIERYINRKSARIWGLFTKPQENCEDKPVVYHGRYWIENKYMKYWFKTDSVERRLNEYKQLYLGPVIHEPN